ncbi:hypothetical protein RFI_14660 [Reticulomyxa filosa]|uniref:Uncharacterized protein n=1 Tax=Reticulomyxa filosa TaxID=46433 RepID=X6N8D3_RETFI|nr:hypothetical protein RFI_14660 [Reticulomyxa filosa]|eukprot:ETO22540.1 hypothetical protein RFI_14660 [Reticulomyxa filosa]
MNITASSHNVSSVLDKCVITTEQYLKEDRTSIDSNVQITKWLANTTVVVSFNDQTLGYTILNQCEEQSYENEISTSTNHSGFFFLFICFKKICMYMYTYFEMTSFFIYCLHTGKHKKKTALIGVLITIISVLCIVAVFYFWYWRHRKRQVEWIASQEIIQISMHSIPKKMQKKSAKKTAKLPDTVATTTAADTTNSVNSAVNNTATTTTGEGALLLNAVASSI